MVLDPLALVSEFSPPTYLFQSMGDKLILPIETIESINTLIKHNVNYEYHFFSEGEHGLSTCDSLSFNGRVYPKRIHQWVPMELPS